MKDVLGSQKARHAREALIIPILTVGLGVLAVGSLLVGRYPLSVGQILHVLVTTSPFEATGRYQDAPWVVVELVRLPRILMVVLCGMGLGLCGAATQGVLRNPLVAPEIAGVSAGASFGGVLGILLGWPIIPVVALAFGFGLLALATSFGLARLGGRSGSLAIVLAGVIVGTLFSALVGLAQYLAEPQTQLPALIYWLLGSFTGASYEKVRVVAAVMLGAGTALVMLRWRINLLSLGEIDARALGVNVSRLRWGVVALVALIVAAQVSVSGGVGWVGLVVPHLVRMLVGPDHSKLLPASALAGGLYLLAMDDIARAAVQQEIPIGLLTAAVGAPVFALLYWRLGDKGWARE